MTAAPARLRVAVVEDDDGVAALHERYIAAADRLEFVGRASSVAEAARLLDATHPDLVLLDVYLPDGTGIDLLRRLRAQRPGAYDVIMVTSAAELPVVERAMHLGVHDYLLKPFSPTEFARRIAAYANGRQGRPQGAVARSLTQREIDAMRSPQAAGSPSRSPRTGLASASTELVAEALRAAGAPVTATEIGAATGMSRVSARRHLEQLVQAGTATSRPRFGEQGRPHIEYSWAG